MIVESWSTRHVSLVRTADQKQTAKVISRLPEASAKLPLEMRNVEDVGEPAVAQPDSTTQAVTSATPSRMSDQIAGLIAVIGERPVPLREVVAVLRGRAYILMLLLLAIPFCTPIPLPGLSTPFGVVIALIGFRLSINQKAWVPPKLLDRTLPPGFLKRWLQGARRMVRLLERFLHPRWRQLAEAEDSAARLWSHYPGVRPFAAVAIADPLQQRSARPHGGFAGRRDVGARWSLHRCGAGGFCPHPGLLRGAGLGRG